MGKRFNLILLFLFSTLHLFSQTSLDSDTTATDSPYKLPFNFDFIIGVIAKDYAKVGNTLANGRVPSILLAHPYDLLRQNSISIGRVLEEPFTDYSDKLCKRRYFEAYYHGKQFYISADDVIFTDEMQQYLDTLSSTSEEVQNEFAQQAKELGLYMHNKKVEEIANLYKKHSASGLSIKEWSI